MTLAESLGRARFSVVSPNRTIRVDASVTGGVDLHFVDDPRARHSTASLERQLGLVLATTMRTREEVFRKVADRERAEAGVEGVRDNGSSSHRQTDIRAEGESRHRWVKIAWEPDGEFTVTIDAVRYRRASTDALRWEVLSAVYDVLMDQREQWARARRKRLGRVFEVRGEGRE